MKPKNFFIGLAIISVSTLVFTLPMDSEEIVIPSLLFAGLFGGLYIGYIRKRPLISCLYDALILGLIASILQAAIVLPLLWYYHGFRYNMINPVRFFLLWFFASVILGGFSGSPIGGLIMGLFYRYLIRDRGEKELYESYIEEKTSEKRKKKDLLE
ncbi:MAG: hypothetical protein FK731_06480 [Asgard group archaeon]|nr:hypothetical protein [Asgard group archaeon]